MGRSEIKPKRKDTRTMALVPSKERLMSMYKNLEREFSLKDFQKESLRVLYKLRRTKHLIPPAQHTTAEQNENCNYSNEETKNGIRSKRIAVKSSSTQKDKQIIQPTSNCATNNDKKRCQRNQTRENQNVKEAAWMEAYKIKRNLAVKPLQKANAPVHRK